MAPWPLGLARRLAYPKLTISLGVAVASLAYFGASGAWFPEQYTHTWSSSRQITGMALTFTLMLSYLSGFSIYTAAKTLEHVETLRPLFVDAAAESLVAGLNQLDPLRFALATAVGVVIGCFNIDWRVIFEIGRVPTWPMDLSMVLGSMAVWIFAAELIYSRAHNAFLLSRLGRHFIEVDLFQTEQLKAFARIGILDLLLVMGALAITPLQALDAEFRIYNYTFALAIALPTGLFLLVSPMWGIHRRLQQEKASALAEVESSIAAANRDHATQSLSRLNALLERRAHLRGLHTWPMDLRGVSRVAFYLVIPPLAWVGAALVEILVVALLGASGAP